MSIYYRISVVINVVDHTRHTIIFMVAAILETQKLGSGVL